MVGRGGLEVKIERDREGGEERHRGGREVGERENGVEGVCTVTKCTCTTCSYLPQICLRPLHELCLLCSELQNKTKLFSPGMKTDHQHFKPKSIKVKHTSIKCTQC